MILIFLGVLGASLRMRIPCLLFFALILYVQSKRFGHDGTSLPGMNQW